MRAAVAMGADIDNNRAGLHLDLVCAEQEKNIEPATCHMRGIKSARTRHQAEIQRRDARRRAVQHGKSVPAILYRAKFSRRFCGKRHNGRTVLARKNTRAHKNKRTLRSLHRFRELAATEGG